MYPQSGAHLNGPHDSRLQLEDASCLVRFGLGQHLPRGLSLSLARGHRQGQLLFPRTHVRLARANLLEGVRLRVEG